MAKKEFFRYELIFTLIAILIIKVTADCNFPTSLKNGNLVYERQADSGLQMAVENYVLRFKCRRGFLLSGNKLSVCMDGSWSSEPPTCMKIFCRDPANTRNGDYVIEKGLNPRPYVGSTATYSCKEGFEIIGGNEVLTCVMEDTRAKWNGTSPTCREKVSCPDPGISPDGSRELTGLYQGDIMTFSCNEGHRLIGKPEIQCLPGGKWDSPRPRCQPLSPHCDDPPSIANGQVVSEKTGDYFVPGEGAIIKCNPGYTTEDADFLYCEEDGNWDEEFSNCIRVSCDLPRSPANGAIVGMENAKPTSLPYLSELTYVCNQGYRLIGNSWTICMDMGWSAKSPYCEVIKCPNPGNPENGWKRGDSFDVGDKITFGCASGFELLGSVERYCLANGQWSGELARCNTERNYCPNPGTPINGIKTSNRYDKGSEIEFRCLPGFSLVGSAFRMCQLNRRWSGTEAKCLGPYDFDNKNDVREQLKMAMEEKANEQKQNINEYLYSEMDLKLLNPSVTDAMEEAMMRRRILNVNHPGRLILYFIFDSSGSVGHDNFRISIDFAKALVHKVKISPLGARVGALTFSSKAEAQFHPLVFTSNADVINALDKLNFTSGGTAISTALRKVREEMIPLTQAHFGKIGLKSAIFIFTDGKANMGGDPEEEANFLKEAGVEIYCIGITGSVKKNSLYTIASEPTNEHVFILNNYQTLAWLVQEITNGTVDYSQCGLGLERVTRRHRVKRDERSRVIGGENATDPWPWMAAIYYMKRNGIPELHCGGSIIGRRWILTAGHCVYNKTTAEVMIKLGLTHVKNESSLQEFEIEEFKIHENYDRITYDNDIAVIKLSRIIDYTPFVRPICLPPKDLPTKYPLYKAKDIAYVTGWGHDKVVAIGSSGTSSVHNLKELKIPIQSRQTCKESIKFKDPRFVKFTEGMFCAGTGLGDVDTCQGDSGGPLMQSQLNNESDVYWVQIGIVSWGFGCGQRSQYGFYANVHYFLDWIIGHLASN